MLLSQNRSARNWLCALGLLPLAAGAHDTIIFDPSAPSPYSINGTWSSSAPVVLHGVAAARLRQDDLQIELTMADGAAYELLDAKQATAGTANAARDVDDAHFQQDQPLFIQRARTFFVIANNGAALEPLAVEVELTPAREMVFRLTYPPATPGTLRLELTYLDKIPRGGKDLLTVLDNTERTLGSATLGVGNPSLEVAVPSPKAALAQGLGKAGIVLASVLVIAVVLFLLHQLGRRRPAA